MNKTLLAVAVALAYSVTPAWASENGGGPAATRGGGQSDPSLTVDVAVNNVANDNSHDNGERNAKNLGGYGNAAANNGSTANAAFSNSFNESKAIAKDRVERHRIGNQWCRASVTLSATVVPPTAPPAARVAGASVAQAPAVLAVIPVTAAMAALAGTLAPLVMVVQVVQVALVAQPETSPMLGASAGYASNGSADAGNGGTAFGA